MFASAQLEDGRDPGRVEVQTASLPGHACIRSLVGITCKLLHSAITALGHMPSRNVSTIRIVPLWEPADLHMEQVAVLDFLVLARAQRVVGLAASTFSTYLRE